MKRPKNILAATFICLLSVLTVFAQEEKSGAFPAWEKGASGAKFVIEVFNDYQCSACAASNNNLKQVLEKHPNEILIIYRHFPLTNIHKQAMLAAQAVEAAGKQNKFWEMGDLILEKQREWADVKNAEEIFIKYAEKLDLNIDWFKKDLYDAEIIDRINLDIERAKSLKVSSTPSAFVNGEILPFEKFSNLEEHLFPNQPK